MWYRVLNWPWRYVPLWWRAVRVSRHRQRIETARHITWAESLLGRAR